MLPGLILNSWSQISIRPWEKLAVQLLFSSQHIFPTFRSLLSWQTWKTSFSWYLLVNIFLFFHWENRRNPERMFTCFYQKPQHLLFAVFLLHWMKLQSYLRPTTLLALYSCPSQPPQSHCPCDFPPLFPTSSKFALWYFSHCLQNDIIISILKSFFLPTSSFR